MFMIICRYSDTCTYSIYINTYTHFTGRCGSELGTTYTICDILVSFGIFMCYFQYSCVISKLWIADIICDIHVLFVIFMCYFRYSFVSELGIVDIFCDIRVLFRVFMCYFRYWDHKCNLRYACLISEIS